MRWIIVVAALVPHAAIADDAPPVLPTKLTREPPPPALHMRRATIKQAAATPAAARPSPVAPKPAAPPAPAPAPAPSQPADATGVRDPQQPVAFRVNLGYVVDGNEPSGQAPIGQNRVPSSGTGDWASIRSYGFGEIYGSTHGVGVQSVSSYIAARFILSERQLFDDDGKKVVEAPPIATWFDRSTYEIRSGWGEAKDFLPQRYLAKLRIRGGRQYVYGPWVVHMDGGTIAWDGKLLSGQLYAGQTVADYVVPGAVAVRTPMVGLSARLDLRDLDTPVPVAVSVDGLELGGHDNGQLGVEWRPRRDFALIGEARTLDGALAHEHAQLRGTYKQVSNVVIDISRRLSSDWRWDPTQVGADDPTSPRQYLQLGPVIPQTIVSARGGTVIADNIDLLLRVAASRVDDLPTDTGEKSSFTATYLELGGALEVRLRRTIALGFSGLNRETQRNPDTIVDVAGTPQALPPSAAEGELGFTELGTSLRLSFGARKFSALLEIYGRRTRYAHIYALDPDSGEPAILTTETRGGGRVSVDAWIGDRLRLFAAYDLATALSFAPESTGYKSLKLMVEGVY